MCGQKTYFIWFFFNLLRFTYDLSWCIVHLLLKKMCCAKYWKWWFINIKWVVVVKSLSLSDSLWPHLLQHPRLLGPSLSRQVCSDSCPSSQWCHPTSSSSVTPFSACPQSLPASGVSILRDSEWLQIFPPLV